MQESDLTIYHEFFFSGRTRSEVEALWVSHALWAALFNGELPNFETAPTGSLRWRRFFLWKVTATFKVVAYKKNEHLLLDISAKKGRSTLLLTMEDKEGGVLLHLDHRSFSGKEAQAHFRFFSKYWKKAFRVFDQSKGS